MLTKTELERVRDSLTAGERRLIWDDEVAGFGARVSAGKIVFVLNYRHGRVERRMTLGTLGEFRTVAAARSKAAALKLEVRSGADVLQQVRDKRKVAEGRLTLAAAVEIWREANPQWAKATADGYRQTLARNVLPRLGHHDLDSITRQQWARLLTDIRKDKPALAHHLHNILNGFLAWCIDHEMLAASTLPSAKRVAPKTGVRERVVSDDEVRRIWAASEALEPRKQAFVKFVVLSAMRSGEAAETRSEWIADGAICYPASAMKGRAEHRVALSPWGWEQVAPALQWRVGEYMFRPLGNLSDLLAVLRKTSGISDWRFHDLRRSFRSWCAKTPGISQDASEVALAHRIHRDDLAKAYQQHRFEEESERAFHQWQDHVKRLVTGGGANVVPMRKNRRT